MKTWYHHWSQRCCHFEYQRKGIIQWELRSYQTSLGGPRSREVKDQDFVPLLGLQGHHAWIPRSLDVIPRPCDISAVVLHCPSILAILISLSGRNLCQNVLNLQGQHEVAWGELQRGSIFLTGIFLPPFIQRMLQVTKLLSVLKKGIPIYDKYYCFHQNC